MSTEKLRSFLYLRPGEAFAATTGGGAGALLLGLGGAGDRDAARLSARAVIEAARRSGPGPALFVRVAPAESGDIDADLAALIPAAPDGVFLEDARGRASVERLSAKLAVIEAESGLASGATKIVALAAQSPAGVFGLGNYAGCSQRLIGLAFDAAGLRAALGAAAAEPIAHARALLSLGAAAAGAPAYDGPDEAEDGAAFAARCIYARDNGFSGKIALSAAQARVIDEIFE